MNGSPISSGCSSEKQSQEDLSTKGRAGQRQLVIPDHRSAASISCGVNDANSYNAGCWPTKLSSELENDSSPALLVHLNLRTLAAALIKECKHQLERAHSKTSNSLIERSEGLIWPLLFDGCPTERGSRIRGLRINV